MSTPTRVLGAACAAALVLAIATPARADASSWMFVGGGASRWKQTDAYKLDPALLADLGVGSSPDGALIVGGIGRVQVLFGSGTDLGVLARVATRGFQGGWFGLAFDGGGYARFWGPQDSFGFWGDAVLGGPLGLQLTVDLQAGSANVLGFGAVAGLDLARLTVYRLNVIDWWPNPKPAQTRTGRR